MPAPSEPQQQDTSEFLRAVLEAAKWVYENSSTIGTIFAEMTNGVTNVKEWVNETGQDVEVYKFDGSSSQQDRYRLSPGQARHNDMWIPWADNAQQYARKHAVMLVSGQPVAYLWQSGRLVRFNVRDEFVVDGEGVPGASGAGGNRRMTIGIDPQGRIGFVVSRI
jgi:hypothetical protein